MKTSAVVRELLGDGDRTEANPGTFENVLVETSPRATECGADEVVVAVHAATVNYPDLLQTVGGYQHKPNLPYTPGTEFSGIVTMRGSDTQLKVPTTTSPHPPVPITHSIVLQLGDRVAATWPGSMATEVTQIQLGSHS